ncbi:MAG: hypothetical protein O3C69_05220 [Chloroflexi bacterium]|nr:hypothetical protein [Chloroflexota bacterium]MDA1257940.1 hypothetical protein [Chloroflexota bacterium]
MVRQDEAALRVHEAEGIAAARAQAAIAVARAQEASAVRDAVADSDTIGRKNGKTPDLRNASLKLVASPKWSKAAAI